MKLVVVCTALLISLAQADRDWSQIKTRVHPFFAAFQSKFESRIVGGKEAIPHGFPYQVALLVEVARGTAFCGGSLVSTKFVLTAAHCADKAKSIEIILGAHNVREDEPNQVRRTAKNIIVHKKWSQFTLQNDIALIELSEEVPINDYIQLISLPSRSDEENTFAGESATASGWGKDSDQSNTISPVLRYVESEVITNTQCNRRYFGVIQPSHICTSGKGGKSTCSGDSGGPLVIANKQIGIVSFGIAFGCEIGWPAAFTRVTSYLDWIAEHSDVIISN